MLLICCYFDNISLSDLNVAYLPFHTPQKLSKVESPIGIGILDFPIEIHKAPENLDCQCLF